MKNNSIINNITTIIFDFDGVIVDTDKSRYKILHDILLKYDINLNKQIPIKKLLGLSTSVFLRQNFNLRNNEIEDIINERHKIFLNNLDKYCIPNPNMKEVIDYLYNKYNLFLATVNTKNIINNLLEYLGIKQLFQKIFTREIMENEQSGRKDYFKLKKKIKNDVKKYVVIEDSEVGIKAAEKENFFCIYFNPYNIKIDSNNTVKNFLELKKIFDKN